MCKADFTGNDIQRVVFPWIIERLRYTSIIIEMWQKDSLVRNETQSEKRYHVIGDNWIIWKKIWYYTFYEELRIIPEKHPVFLTEAPMNPKNQ